MTKSLKDKLVDMVVMTVARDATRTVLNQAKRGYTDAKEMTGVRKRTDEDKDEELEP